MCDPPAPRPSSPTPPPSPGLAAGSLSSRVMHTPEADAPLRAVRVGEILAGQASVWQASAGAASFDASAWAAGQRQRGTLRHRLTHWLGALFSRPGSGDASRAVLIRRNAIHDNGGFGVALQAHAQAHVTHNQVRESDALRVLVSACLML